MTPAHAGGHAGEVAYAAVDDGTALAKCITSEGFAGAFPDPVANGFVDPKGLDYETAGKRFVVDDGIFADPSQSQWVSDANRVVVSHALHRAGLSGRKVALATGLPFVMFYREDGSVDEVARQAKLESFRQQVRHLDGAESPEVVSHLVLSLGVSAWFDHVFDDAGVGRVGVDASAPLAVIDVGVSTTEYVVVPGPGRVDPSASVSLPIGLADVWLRVLLGLTERFQAGDIPRWSLDRMARARVVRFRGETRVIGDIVDASVRAVAEEISGGLSHFIGGGLADMVLVGGGADLLRGQLSLQYPNIKVPVEPAYANARGMLKFLRNHNPVEG